MDMFELKRFNVEAAYPYKQQYDNYIGGQWVPPSAGRYFENVSPITGKPFTKVAQSDADDVNRALDAAHAAQAAWAKTSVAERSNILLKIADRMEQHLQTLAIAETIDNGKPLRETMAADIPLAIDHFRYFAGAVRAQEGGISEIDADTIAYHFHEPLGVVGQIIPWNFPILMAVWKLAPALAAGNCVVLKPAEQTPASILVLMEIIGDLLPPGVVNVVNGFGTNSAGSFLTAHPGVNGITFTGETKTGTAIMKAAADGIRPVSLELGGNAPFIVFDDADLDAAVEGALISKYRNNGQTCVCVNRFYVQRGAHDAFVEKLVAAVARLEVGDGFALQLCQGHCPVQPVAEEFPLLCEAETQAFGRLLNIHVQRLATLAGGGHVCTTHVPLSVPTPSTVRSGTPPRTSETAITPPTQRPP